MGSNILIFEHYWLYYIYIASGTAHPWTSCIHIRQNTPACIATITYIKYQNSKPKWLNDEFYKITIFYTRASFPYQVHFLIN